MNRIILEALRRCNLLPVFYWEDLASPRLMLFDPPDRIRSGYFNRATMDADEFGYNNGLLIDNVSN